MKYTTILLLLALLICYTTAFLYSSETEDKKPCTGRKNKCCEKGDKSECCKGRKNRCSKNLRKNNTIDLNLNTQTK